MDRVSCVDYASLAVWMALAATAALCALCGLCELIAKRNAGRDA